MLSTTQLNSLRNIIRIFEISFVSCPDPHSHPPYTKMNTEFRRMLTTFFFKLHVTASLNNVKFSHFGLY